MKPSHVAALALVFIMLASCGPDMATIRSANERAERAAERAQAAQLQTERSAELAKEAVERTKSADFIENPDGSGSYSKGSAKWWAIGAEEAEEGMCTFAKPIWGKLNPGPSENSLYALRLKACSER